MLSARTLIHSAVVFCLAILLAACGSVPERHAAPVTAPDQPASQPQAADPVKDALYAQYRYGGLSKRGIDCSGFVYTTFRKHFDQHLPRTTAGQARVGYAVPRDAVTAGDLVFFRTSTKGRHVGIYIEDGQFLHASTSEGVVLSNLEDHYWSAHYWKAQRPSDRLAGR